MPSRKTNPAAPEMLNKLLPDRLSYLLEERPTLPYESDEDYDALLAEFIAEYDPQGVTEFILVKELSDLQWDLQRTRTIRRVAIETELPKAAASLMRDAFCEATGTPRYEGERGVIDLVRRAEAGQKESRKELDALTRDAGVTRRMMEYEAVSVGLKTITALDDAIARAERRRDHVIRMIEDRRRNLKSMTKSLLGDAKPSDAVTIEPCQEGGA